MVQVSRKIIAWATLAVGTTLTCVKGAPTTRATCARPNFGPFVLTAVLIDDPTSSFSLRLDGAGTSGPNEDPVSVLGWCSQNEDCGIRALEWNLTDSVLFVDPSFNLPSKTFNLPVEPNSSIKFVTSTDASSASPDFCAVHNPRIDEGSEPNWIAGPDGDTDNFAICEFGFVGAHEVWYKPVTEGAELFCRGARLTIS